MGRQETLRWRLNRCWRGARRMQEKKEHRELGSLQSLVVAPRTLTRYFEAVSLFLEFLQLHDYPYPSTFLLLDGRVCEYIEYLWQNGESKALHLIV